MLSTIISVIAFLIFTILIMSAIILICIYVAIRNGEDIESDKVRDKYVEIATGISLLIAFTVFILFN